VADEADRAQDVRDLADAFQADALRRRKKAEGTGRKHCLECQEIIPLARRRAVPQAVRCAFCQQLSENRSQ
jgi:phage/conjugal plasmid C-4 type zinc finger TraR family protein